ncbi:hypothetical protein O7599_14090 [Streptomyces sp. WMMC500]|nr:hypothetical protein [Streptomyces sp. WMMC500]WBB63579.1 hypothetical protein O7599_14090 [Streptomyces sp. WMMC500]
MLEARGIPVDDTTRERITSRTDRAVLDTWLVRAITATTADDLFADPAED